MPRLNATHPSTSTTVTRSSHTGICTAPAMQRVSQCRTISRSASMFARVVSQGRYAANWPSFAHNSRRKEPSDSDQNLTSNRLMYSKTSIICRSCCAERSFHGRPFDLTHCYAPSSVKFHTDGLRCAGARAVRAFFRRFLSRRMGEQHASQYTHADTAGTLQTVRGVTRVECWLIDCRSGRETDDGPCAVRDGFSFI